MSPYVIFLSYNSFVLINAIEIWKISIKSKILKLPKNLWKNMKMRIFILKLSKKYFGNIKMRRFSQLQNLVENATDCFFRLSTYNKGFLAFSKLRNSTCD